MRLRTGLMTLALVLSAFLAEGTALARLHRATRIDTDISAADMTIIGTVGSAKVIQKRVPGPFSSTVEIRELRVRVVISLTGAKEAQVVRVRHPRLLPSGPTANGFNPAVLETGRTYLLFLKAHKDGYHELLTVEDSNLVTFSPSVLAKLARGSSSAPSIERVVDALTTVVTQCNDECMGAIWLLDSSRVFAKRHDTVRDHKRKFIDTLVRITKRCKDHNTLLAAYTVLGGFGVRSVLPDIIGYLCRKPKGPRADLSNAISWLQGFPKAVEIDALKKVVRKAVDPGVVSAAKYRLGWLTPR